MKVTQRSTRLAEWYLIIFLWKMVSVSDARPMYPKETRVEIATSAPVPSAPEKTVSILGFSPEFFVTIIFIMIGKSTVYYTMYHRLRTNKLIFWTSSILASSILDSLGWRQPSHAQPQLYFWWCIRQGLKRLNHPVKALSKKKTRAPKSRTWNHRIPMMAKTNHH